LNAGTTRDGTVMAMSGCLGLRARRWPRLRFSKVPKPTSATRSPFATVSRIVSIEASTTLATSALF